MRLLGKVFNFSPKGSIVVKAITTPRIGQVVCDNKGRPLGKVVRITGPVASPYVLVSSMAKDEMSMYRLSGKQVFLEERYDRPPARERRPRPAYQDSRKEQTRSGRGKGRKDTGKKQWNGRKKTPRKKDGR